MKTDLNNYSYKEKSKDFAHELSKEVKYRFRMLEDELASGIEERFELDTKLEGDKLAEMKKQLIYNLFFGLVLDLETEMVGDKDVDAVAAIIEDYDNCCIDDTRSIYFGYLYNTDTRLAYE